MKINIQKSENKTTFFLFTTPSFMSGFARFFDFWSQFTSYNTSKSSEQADLNAIKRDWIAVGQDIQSAINKYGKTIH